MKFKSNMIAFGLILLLVATGMVFAQDSKMKMDEYKAQLAESQTEQTETATEITKIDEEIAALDQEIEATQTEIDATWDEIFALLGTDKAGYEAYQAELASIDSKIDGLAALTPEELFKAKDEIKEIEAQIEDAKAENL